VRPVDKSING